MSPADTADGQGDDRILGLPRRAPTVPRMVLGAQLRRLRDACGLTRADAGRAIGVDERSIALMELGRADLSPREVSVLLAAYGVADDAERITPLALAEQVDAPGWWQPYADVVPEWLRPYLELEQAADLIRTFEAQLLPGLLQTETYARALITLGRRDAPRKEIDRRVELRMRRQRILHGPSALRLWAVIDEAALRRPLGGPAAMRAQLRHLIDMAALPNVSIQVMPFHAGVHPAVGGAITMVRLPGESLPDVVYLEDLTGARYPDDPAEIAYYWDVMNRLVTRAEPPIATPAILDRIIREG